MQDGTARFMRQLNILLSDYYHVHLAPKHNEEISAFISQRCGLGIDVSGLRELMTREEAENWIASLINLVREECLAIENSEFAKEVRLEKKIKECTTLIVAALTGKEE